MTEPIHALNTISHQIQVDDDIDGRKAICSNPNCGTLYDGTDRNKKMAACHRHLADVLDPPESVGTPA